MTNSLTRKVQEDLYSILKAEWDRLFPSMEADKIIKFLTGVWDLYEMKSEDPRYDNAYGDVYQHIINNSDWDSEYLFKNRLLLFKDQTKFIDFVEAFLHPEFINDSEVLSNLYTSVNAVLLNDGLSLAIEDFNDSNLPIYRVVKADTNNSLPYGVKKNRTVFFVDKHPSGRSDYSLSHKLPIEFPSFVAVYNSWDDYDFVTTFDLYYYSNKNNVKPLGKVKIMNKDVDVTAEVIPDRFNDLDHDYCSLGQSDSYYTELKTVCGDDFYSILFALKDAAFFPEIQEKFEKKSVFINSLIRNDSAERRLRIIKYVIGGFDMDSLFHFHYKFKPKYSDRTLDVPFKFDDREPLPNRIYALIGKNGVGKTQLITSLPVNFSKGNTGSFEGKIPIFSKTIAVSYSVFDSFEIPKKHASFNYVYCGLRNEKGEIRSEQSLILSFYHSCRKIKELNRVDRWRSVLLNFLSELFIDSFVNIKEDHENILSGDLYEIDTAKYKLIKRQLSSGQGIILFVITEIISNIRYDSLILFDEPETHLHPNAITQLINTIYELVNEFKSYCIIGTHSPLIIRELHSKNVFVMERTGDYPDIRRISIECFGENLGVLTDEVFGNREVPKQYKLIVDALVNQKKTFEEIVNLLEYDDYPLSLNASIYIQNVIASRNDQS